MSITASQYARTADCCLTIPSSKVWCPIAHATKILQSPWSLTHPAIRLSVQPVGRQYSNVDNWLLTASPCWKDRQAPFDDEKGFPRLCRMWYVCKCTVCAYNSHIKLAVKNPFQHLIFSNMLYLQIPIQWSCLQIWRNRSYISVPQATNFQAARNYHSLTQRNPVYIVHNIVGIQYETYTHPSCPGACNTCRNT